MPIDLTLLRPLEEGGNISQVKQWQLCRLSKNTNKDIHHDDDFVINNVTSTNHSSTSSSSSSSNNNHNDENECIMIQNVETTISKISQFEQKKRQLLKEECQARAKLNQLQSLLAPTSTLISRSTTNKEQIKHDIQLLKKDIIPNIKKESVNITKLIDIHSPKLMNIVITTKDDNYDDIIELDREKVVNNNDKVLFLDPLYCIGGYEKIRLPTSISEKGNIGDEEKAYLCGYGSIIYDALQQYIKEATIEAFSIDTTIDQCLLNISDSIPLQSKELAHSLIGCPFNLSTIHEYSNNNDKCFICKMAESKSNNNDQFINVPSHIVMSILYQNKSFTDRELPKQVIGVISTSKATITGYGKQSCSLMHSINRLETMVMATSNLKLSIEIQDSIVRNIVNMYKGLLVSMTELKKYNGENHIRLTSNTHNSKPLLRTRAIRPCDLEPSEARRIVIEGYIPSAKKYVCLAHVSNYTDYISRGLKIKCIGSQGQPVQYVYMLHGCISNMKALEWLLENNIACHIGREEEPTADQFGVIIPDNVVDFIADGTTKRCFDSKSMLFIPFIRELVKRKKGGVTTKEMKGSKPLWLQSIERPQAHKTMRSRRTNDSNSRHHTFELPSAKDENACNPYDFLPMLL